MPNPTIAFENCDAEFVLDEIGRGAVSPAMRSLWNPLHAEMRHNGPAAAASYLEGEFGRLKQDFNHELERARLRTQA